VAPRPSDIPASAIDEFQIGQSFAGSFPIIDSSGGSRNHESPGTNTLHCEAFGFIRDHNFAANSRVDMISICSATSSVAGGRTIIRTSYRLPDANAPADSFWVAFGRHFLRIVGVGSFRPAFSAKATPCKVDSISVTGSKAFYRYSYFSNPLFATFGLGFSV